MHNVTQYILFFLESISNYSLVYNDNQDLKILFKSYSTIMESFENDYSDQTIRKFTKEQEHIIHKYTCLHLFKGTIDSFQKIYCFIDDHLYIFFSDSVKFIPDKFFCKYLSLSIITLQNSNTVIGRKCFQGCSSLISIKMPNATTMI
jgi:hypothetical protein